MLGLLGPNGAGKTTLLKCLVGLLHPTQGSVEVLGEDVAAAGARIRQRVGLMIGRPATYGYLSGRENLRLRARFFPGAEARIEELLDLVDLREAAGRPAATYSTGMAQRLGLAAALLPDPELLILDEPTNGMDPAGQAELRDLLTRVGAEAGRTVLVSSHQLHEIEQVCDRVAIMRAGSVVATGEVRQLLAPDGAALRATVDDLEAGAAALRALDEVDAVEVAGGALEVRGRGDLAPAVARALCDAGAALRALEPRRRTLEQLFLEVLAAPPEAATSPDAEGDGSPPPDPGARGEAAC